MSNIISWFFFLYLFFMDHFEVGSVVYKKYTFVNLILWVTSMHVLWAVKFYNYFYIKFSISNDKLQEGKLKLAASYPIEVFKSPNYNGHPVLQQGNQVHAWGNYTKKKYVRKGRERLKKKLGRCFLLHSSPKLGVSHK